MAAARLDIPAILVSGGPMLTGEFQGRDVDLITVFESVGKVKVGTMTPEDLNEMEGCACPGVGSCAGMFTANSMNCLSEVLGLALPYNGTIPAVFAERIRLAKETAFTSWNWLSKTSGPRGSSRNTPLRMRLRWIWPLEDQPTHRFISRRSPGRQGWI